MSFGKGRFRLPKGRLWGSLLILVVGIAFGGIVAFVVSRKEFAADLTQAIGGQRARPGPWGEIYFSPFVITAPEKSLPVRSIEAGGTRWILKNFTIAGLSQLLEVANLPELQRAALLGLGVAQVKGADVELAPTPAMVLALPEKARQAIYRTLARDEESRSSLVFIHKDTLDARFGDSGIGPETLALFHQLCCTHGDYLVFSGLPAMLAMLPTDAEKLRFMKALTRQQTMLVRLHVTKDSDLTGLTAYWGKGIWDQNIQTILEGVGSIRGGTFVNIVTLLPPLPSAELYFYTLGQDIKAGAAETIHDCHWTTMNFFRGVTDATVTGANLAKELNENYFRISDEPRYGDVLVLTKRDGQILHSAVFIADNVVFTKNGSTAIYPWMFSTIPDILKQYSFLAPDEQQLVVAFYRNRRAGAGA